MRGLVLTAVSPVGDRALRRALRDDERAPLKDRLAYRALYLQTVLSEVPFSLRIEHRIARYEAVIPPSSILPPIVLALRANGALKDIDYVVVFDE